MKEPNVTNGVWLLDENDSHGQPNVISDEGNQLIAVIAHECVKPEEETEANAIIIMSSKSLAACLHRQMERLRTMPNWELITRPTKAEMVEEMRQALLEAGYQDA